MITSTKDPERWIFPKGGWETDETLEEAVRRETLEVRASLELREAIRFSAQDKPPQRFEVP